MIRFFEKLYKKDKDSLLALLRQNLDEEQRMFNVTANPEAFMFGQKNEEMKQLLPDDATTVVADGIGIEAGTLRLVGTDSHVIYRETHHLLTDSAEYERMCKASNPYGDGHASERIVDAIIAKFASVLVEKE